MSPSNVPTHFSVLLAAFMMVFLGSCSHKQASQPAPEVVASQTESMRSPSDTTWPYGDNAWLLTPSNETRMTRGLASMDTDTASAASTRRAGREAMPASAVDEGPGPGRTAPMAIDPQQQAVTTSMWPFILFAALVVLTIAMIFRWRRHGDFPGQATAP